MCDRNRILAPDERRPRHGKRWDKYERTQPLLCYPSWCFKHTFTDRRVGWPARKIGGTKTRTTNCCTLVRVGNGEALNGAIQTNFHKGGVCSGAAQQLGGCCSVLHVVLHMVGALVGSSTVDDRRLLYGGCILLP